MSYSLLHNILSRNESKHSVRLVLLVIAHFSVGTTGLVATPEFIAEKARIHIRNVIIIINKLEKRGHLQVKHCGSMTRYKIQKSAWGE